MTSFFLLTFALSWCCFLPATHLHGAPQSALLLVGTFAPAIVAIGQLAREQGRAGLGAFFRRRFIWDSSAKWYVFAISFFPVVKLAAAVAHRVIAGAWPRFGTEAWYIIAIAIVFSSPMQSGEEIQTS